MPHQIIGGYNRKEKKALEWIFNKYYSSVYSIIWDDTKGSNKTKDLVHDVFVILFKNENRIDRIKKLKNFLYITAKNLSRNVKKRQDLERTHSDKLDGLYSVEEEYPYQRAERRAYLTRLVYLSVDKLASKCKEVFLLYYEMDLSNEEIASLLNISVKSVSNYKALALRKLKMDFDRAGVSRFFSLIF